ncbi:MULTISPECIES: hypothetical protein [unclassified Helicobacter]|uniref:hypothetical protein n=1 Tax=unclassified Helicobacter TaxID=2593540 RepID=UPI0009EF46DF|nr:MULTISPECIES: hypothetical protein [unclassified Helicobacter]
MQMQNLDKIANGFYAYEGLNKFGKVLYFDAPAMQSESMKNAFLYRNILECIDIYTQFESRELKCYSAIIIPMSIDEVELAKHTKKLVDYLNDGGIIISFASNFSKFLPYASSYIQSPTPIRERSIKIGNHVIFEGVREYDINYRRGVKGFFNRGYFDVSGFPKGGEELEIILKDSDDKCVCYIDRTSSNGVVLASAGADLLQFGLFDNTTARKMGLNLLRWLENELTQKSQKAQNSALESKAESKTLDSSAQKSKTLKHTSDFCFQTGFQAVLQSSKTANQPNNTPKHAPSYTPSYTEQKFNLKSAIITGGASYHHYFFINKSQKYANYFSRRIYMQDLGEVDLSEYDVVVIASRINPSFLNPHKDKLRAYLESGGNIISFGEILGDYLPNILWKDYAVNFWWWLIPDADMPLYVGKDGAKLFAKITPDDAKWHCHGAFYPPESAQKILVNELDECIIYKDTSFLGGLYITSLDPEFHLGQGFMPKTEGFFDAFMEWVCEDILQTRKNAGASSK